MKIKCIYFALFWLSIGALKSQETAISQNQEGNKSNQPSSKAIVHVFPNEKENLKKDASTMAKSKTDNTLNKLVAEGIIRDIAKGLYYNELFDYFERETMLEITYHSDAERLNSSRALIRKEIPLILRQLENHEAIKTKEEKFTINKLEEISPRKPEYIF